MHDKGYIKFDFYSYNGCTYWIVDNDNETASERKIIIEETPFEEFEYTLTGIELGFYDRKIRMLCEKRNTKPNK